MVDQCYTHSGVFLHSTQQINYIVHIFNSTEESRLPSDKYIYNITTEHWHQTMINDVWYKNVGREN